MSSNYKKRKKKKEKNRKEGKKERKEGGRKERIDGREGDGGKVGRRKKGRKTDIFKNLIQLHSGPLTFSMLV